MTSAAPWASLQSEGDCSTEQGDPQSTELSSATGTKIRALVTVCGAPPAPWTGSWLSPGWVGTECAQCCQHPVHPFPEGRLKHWHRWEIKLLSKGLSVSCGTAPLPDSTAPITAGFGPWCVPLQ